jgi:hypothetical protein
MPIRINLLAEMQGLEELRRRDPVKRAILAGVVLVILLLGWSSILVFKTIIAKNEISGVDLVIKTHTNEYAQVVSNEKRLTDAQSRLRALHVLVTNRFLNGTLLDTLQRSVVDNVQVTRLKISQNYVLTEEVKPKDEEDTRPAKPATVTEKIMVTLDATDTSPNGEGATHFQNALSTAPYFERVLAKTNGFRLTSIGAPQRDVNGQSFTAFTLEAHLPEKTR